MFHRVDRQRLHDEQQREPLAAADPDGQKWCLNVVAFDGTDTGLSLEIFGRFFGEDIDHVVVRNDAEHPAMFVDNGYRDEVVSREQLPRLCGFIGEIERHDFVAHQIANEGMTRGEDQISQRNHPEKSARCEGNLGAFFRFVEHVNVINRFAVGCLLAELVDRFDGGHAGRQPGVIGRHQRPDGVFLQLDERRNILAVGIVDEAKQRFANLRWHAAK